MKSMSELKWTFSQYLMIFTKINLYENVLCQNGIHFVFNKQNKVISLIRTLFCKTKNKYKDSVMLHASLKPLWPSDTIWHWRTGSWCWWWKSLIFFIKISQTFVAKGSIHKSALGQVMAWWQTVNKPLHEPVPTWWIGSTWLGNKYQINLNKSKYNVSH